MGIYIKGMEMPKSCTECFLYRYDDRLRNEEERHICLRKCWARLVRPTEERQGYCPLLEVNTPHGKLIDADEMARIYHAGSFDVTKVAKKMNAVIEEED